MSVSDPIADFLTMIRNATRVKHQRLDAPASGYKEEIIKLLLREGYIRNYKRIEDGRQGILRIYLKYDRVDGSSIIEGIDRISTPGRRVYIGKGEIPRIRGGLGTAIISSPKGVLSGAEASQAGVGGELVGSVW
ncbi:MAG: 30S ribosomal protein S8 [Candidatus Eisenbacteria sp.]|nr:30S ribosomal protein S8 [Candidatus Eisenbacteria bacterium]